MPALFYFTLSGKDSLFLEPINQPAISVANNNIRVFSFTIPGHGQNLDPKKAMERWAEAIENGDNFIDAFVRLAKKNIDYLIENHYIDPSYIAVGGISRGAFIATHLAAHDSRIGFILGYAPLSRLDILNEFEHLKDDPIVRSLKLEQVSEQLVNKQLRFYIGNHDIRVGTESCFQFIKTVTNAAYVHGVRSPSVELMIFPSVGHKGHGTPPHIFQDGVNWLINQLEKHNYPV